MSNSQGFAAGLGARFPDSRLLFDDDFTQGYCGWQQLVEGVAPRGNIGRVDYPSVKGKSLALYTEEQADSTNYQLGSSMAIKRFMPVEGGKGIYRFVFWLGWEAYHGENRMRCIDIGLDQCYANSERFFPKFRFLNYDESAEGGGGAPDTGVRAQRWQMWSGEGASPTLVDVPNQPAFAPNGGVAVPATGVGIPWPFNENKRNLTFIGVEFDHVNKKYRGLQVGSYKFGTFREPGDARYEELMSTGWPGNEKLDTYREGMNFAVTVRNRINTTACAAAAYVNHPRGYAL